MGLKQAIFPMCPKCYIFLDSMFAHYSTLASVYSCPPLFGAEVAFGVFLTLLIKSPLNIKLCLFGFIHHVCNTEG